MKNEKTSQIPTEAGDLKRVLRGLQSNGMAVGNWCLAIGYDLTANGQRRGGIDLGCHDALGEATEEAR